MSLSKSTKGLFEEAQLLKPARAKEIMDERARKAARPLPTARPAKEYVDVVTFSLANERYAIETRHVFEVTPLVELTPVPGVPDFLVGITNLRGDILAVIDLRRFFSVAGKGITDLSRLIVCGRDNPAFGILADEVLSVQSLGADELETLPGSVGGIGREYLRGVTADALVVLDGIALLSDRRLFVDQKGEPADRLTRGSE